MNKALQDAAKAFRDSHIWALYPADALFAIQYPDGQTGYCAAMGGEGAPVTLMVYMGEAGLTSYYRMRTLPADAPAYRVQETMMRQDCLVCMIGESGPEWRRYTPYQASGPLRDAQEEAHLYYALLGGAFLAGRIEEALRQMPLEQALALTGFDRMAQTIPNLTVLPTSAEGFGMGMARLPEDSRITLDAPVLDEEAAAAMRAIPTNEAQTLLCELVISPKTVQGDTPLHPVGLMLVDPEEGIVGMPVVDDFASDMDELVAALLSFIMEHGKPRDIQVKDDTTYLLLHSVAQQIGQPLTLVGTLREIDALKAAFFDAPEA